MTNHHDRHLHSHHGTFIYYVVIFSLPFSIVPYISIKIIFSQAQLFRLLIQLITANCKPSSGYKVIKN